MVRGSIRFARPAGAFRGVTDMVTSEDGERTPLFFEELAAAGDGDADDDSRATGTRGAMRFRIPEPLFSEIPDRGEPPGPCFPGEALDTSNLNDCSFAFTRGGAGAGARSSEDSVRESTFAGLTVFGSTRDLGFFPRSGEWTGLSIVFCFFLAGLDTLRDFGVSISTTGTMRCFRFALVGVVGDAIT